MKKLIARRTKFMAITPDPIVNIVLWENEDDYIVHHENSKDGSLYWGHYFPKKMYGEGQEEEVYKEAKLAYETR